MSAQAEQANLAHGARDNDGRNLTSTNILKALIGRGERRANERLKDSHHLLRQFQIFHNEILQRNRSCSRLGNILKS